MSSYTIRARNKKTGQVNHVFCFDDYFGRHRYGYMIDNSGKYITEEEFYRYYDFAK